MKNLLTLKKDTNKGITLIALIITIIVLLILAGVSIATLTGENGILTQAKSVKKETEIANAKEQARLDVMAWTAERLSKGLDATLNDTIIATIIYGKDYVEGEPGATSFTTKNGYVIEYAELYTSTPGTEEPDEPKDPVEPEEPLQTAVVGEKVAGNNKIYTKNGTAIIPVGFMIVPGCEDVSEGLVISDDPNDTEEGTNKSKHRANGNQFVWIPVTKENPFERRAGYGNGTLQDISNYGEADSTGINSKLTESKETQAEAIAMYASVESNGGFYIGRYEVGKDSLENIVCKKDVVAYESFKWGNSMTDETGGAVELARNFAEENDYDTTKVHSTLCYGVQWDTALNFIDPGYTGYAKNSTKMGWYEDNYEDKYHDGSTGIINFNPYHIAGSDLMYQSDVGNIPAGEPTNKPKNIYDMAGNIDEWTMESYRSSERSYRGGGYRSAMAAGSPASVRNNADGEPYKTSYGFRLALYL